MSKSPDKLAALIARIDKKDADSKRNEQGEELYQLWRTGQYPNSQVLLAQAMMARHDPANYPRMTISPEELVERYVSLESGQYVLGLYPFNCEKALSGMVKGDPTDFRVVLPPLLRETTTAGMAVTPDVRFSVTIESDGSPERHLMGAGNLSFGAFGRKAIQAVVADTQYRLTGSGKSDEANELFLPDNYAQLKILRDHIFRLYSLGMTKVDTTTLDKALDEGAKASDFRLNMLNMGQT